jgi:nucleotide-binding universal stress UspA family protein
MNEQVTLERPRAAKAQSDQSTLKSILLHVQDDASLEDRLEVALSLARTAGAHLSCLHVTPIQAYVAFDSFGGVFVMQDVMEALDEQEANLRARVEKDLAAEDVTWDYEQVTGDVVGQIVGKAALADLVVFGREPHRHDFPGPAMGTIGDLLQRSQVPLFIPGDEKSPVDVTGTALIAWDGSFEAANAVRSSLGLLKLAKDVAIIRVAEGKEQEFPGTKLLEYLSRHGVHADMIVQDPPAGDRDPKVIAASLVAYARGIGAAYLVMGGYSHNRVREVVFGGVTRSLLKECPIPLVIAH